MSRFSNWRTKRRERIRLRCQAMARRSNEVQAAARLLRPVDADTLRWRALHDARGLVLREGVTFFGDGRVVPWCVRRSLHGRVNQLDVVAGGQIWRTAGRRRLPAALRPDSYLGPVEPCRTR